MKTPDEEIRRAFLVRRGRPSTNVRKLARDNRELALELLVQLMFSGNDCAALGAARSVLERSDGRVPVGTPSYMRKRLDEGIQLTIRQFKELWRSRTVAPRRRDGAGAG